MANFCKHNTAFFLTCAFAWSNNFSTLGNNAGIALFSSVINFAIAFNAEHTTKYSSLAKSCCMVLINNMTNSLLSSKTCEHAKYACLFTLKSLSCVAFTA